jgi:hypothetical protein
VRSSDELCSVAVNKIAGGTLPSRDNIKKMNYIGINGKRICKEWSIPAFHYRHININHPENET